MSARLGTATTMDFASSACAIQKAVRLLPVAHGMIIRPRLAVAKCARAAAIASCWCGRGDRGVE